MSSSLGWSNGGHGILGSVLVHPLHILCWDMWGKLSSASPLVWGMVRGGGGASMRAWEGPAPGPGASLLPSALSVNIWVVGPAHDPARCKAGPPCLLWLPDWRPYWSQYDTQAQGTDTVDRVCPREEWQMLLHTMAGLPAGSPGSCKGGIQECSSSPSSSCSQV